MDSLDLSDVFSYPTFDGKTDMLMSSLPSLDDIGYGAPSDPEQYRISDLSMSFPLKSASAVSQQPPAPAAPSLWTIPTLDITAGLVEPVLSSAPAERNPKSQSISPSPRGTPSPPPSAQQTSRKRKRSSDSSSSSSLSSSSSTSCGSHQNMDGHLKARKDDISEAEIQRLLMLKPSQLTEEERKIRQRAKNRQSAAVAREKRRKKQQAHDNRLKALREKNESLQARLDALEAENAALRKCLEHSAPAPSLLDSDRPLKRHHALH